jgi:protein ImuB
MPRIACLFVPLFPLAARLRSEPELAGEAVVVCEGNGSAARVRAASRAARRFGITNRMTLAQARGVMPSLIARGRDPSCERSAHEALLEVAWSLSPTIEDAAPELVFADVSGMERLPSGDDGERELCLAAMTRAGSLGLVVRAGVAANKLAARIAAILPDSPRIVAPGKEAHFLAPLALSHLDLDRHLGATLSRWGITTIGALAQLPADRIRARLGHAGVQAHQAAQGLYCQPLVPYRLPLILSEGMELEWPVVTIEPLLYALRQSLDRAHRRLAQHDLACALLELDLGLEPEGADHRCIRLPAPTCDIEALLSLIRLEVEAHPPRAPVASFTCILHPDRPRRGQLTLFGAPEIDPDALAATLARIAARIGLERLGSPRIVDGHRPERFTTVAFAPPPPPKLRRPPRRGRGLLVVRVLRPPVELEVIVEKHKETQANEGNDLLSNARLISVASIQGKTPRIQGLVRVAAGPWLLEEGWWSKDDVEREYWDIELSDGGLYRIFRDRHDGNWFADGMYD